MILTPKHVNTSAHQAQKAVSDYAKHCAKCARDEAKRQSDPVGDGTQLMDWQPPASWGEPIERVACRRGRNLPAEGLLFRRHGWHYRLTVKLHGVDP